VESSCASAIAAPAKATSAVEVRRMLFMVNSLVFAF
jgi:hypothetical protein